MQVSSPDASCTVFSSTLATSMAISSSSGLARLRRTRPGFEFAAQHFLKTFAAINDRSGATLPTPRPLAQFFCCLRVDGRRIQVSARDDHDAKIVARRRGRYFAIDDIAQHQIWLAFQRIAPAAAAGGADADDLAGQHRFAVDQAAEVARRPLDIDRDAERQPGFAAVDAVTAEPDPVSGDDGSAIDQCAIM